jgi:hypothetical protein
MFFASWYSISKDIVKWGCTGRNMLVCNHLASLSWTLHFWLWCDSHLRRCGRGSALTGITSLGSLPAFFVGRCWKWNHGWNLTEVIREWMEVEGWSFVIDQRSHLTSDENETGSVDCISVNQPTTGTFNEMARLIKVTWLWETGIGL